MMGGAQKSGGYEAEFDPPLSDDYLCVICLLAFREPMQLPCGHQFCHSCLKKYMKTQDIDLSCPVDREVIDTNKVFPDKSMERKVLSLNVKCHNFRHTCEWSGELRALASHASNCRFKTTKCRNNECPQYVPEIYLNHHMTNECKYREWVCQYCMETLLWKMSREHMDECKYGPAKCANSCGEEDIPRQLMEEHMRVCPLSVLPCSYVNYGCHFAGTLQERVTHEKDDVHNHLGMAVGKIDDLEEQLEARKTNDETISARLHAVEQQMNKNKRLLETKLRLKEAEEKHLQEKIRTLEEQLLRKATVDGSPMRENDVVVIEKEVLRPYSLERRDVNPIEKAYNTVTEREYGAFVWAVDQYRAKLGEAKITNVSIYSEPFYSAKIGYKIRLAASLNGQHSGRGSHVGLRIQLMKGPYDNILLWPFDYKITLLILHQLDESKNVSLTFHPRDLLPEAKEKHFGKPVCDINPGRGKGGLLSHMNIDEDDGFTCNDTIYFMCDLQGSSEN